MIKQLLDGLWVLAHDTHISKWVEEHGRLDCDGQLLPEILKLINPGMVVWDVGAFIGDHTFAYCKAVGDSGHVLAFEPNPFAFVCLVRNCEEYLRWPQARLSVHQAALGDYTGVLPFATHSNAGMCNMTGKEGDFNALCVRTDDVLKWDRVDLIKLDCEGSEYRVLSGMEGMIHAQHPIIVMECHKGTENTVQSLSFLESMGYDIRLASDSMSYEHDQYDVICTGHK